MRRVLYERGTVMAVGVIVSFRDRILVNILGCCDRLGDTGWCVNSKLTVSSWIWKLGLKKGDCWKVEWELFIVQTMIEVEGTIVIEDN